MNLSFEEHLVRERKVQVESTLTRDYEIGVRAMVDHSAPKFTGQ
jgi:hypothetical protein